MFSKDTLMTPPQKKSTKEKYSNDKQWFKDCIDSYEYQSLYYEQEIHRKMNIYFNMDNGELDQNEMEKVFNPLGLGGNTYPSSIKNFPIVVPKIDLLVGEEIKRRFDWTVRSTNPTSESNGASELFNMFMEIAIDEFKKETTDEKELEQRIKEYARFAKYKYKDINEITATKIINYLTRNYSLPYQFNKGFRDALLSAREIYRIDIEGNEPILKVCDPRNVFIIKKGNSEKIEDSEAIIEITYESVGKIIDAFYDDISPEDLDLLEKGQWRTGKNNQSGNIGYSHELPRIFSNLDFGNGTGFVDINEFNNTNFKLGLPYDEQGNVRVVRCRWVGRKKIGIVTFFDENGDENEKTVSEYYKIDNNAGETVRWIWVNEAYEGVKIADNIYIKLQPRKIQMRNYDNKSKCFLGYVGSDYGKSLMGRMEPYQYLYNVYMNKLENLFNKYKGPIYELDISKVPDEWEMDTWLYYAEAMGWAVIDPMNEGKKGAAMGKLAGSYNTTGKVLDPRVGDYIQQTIMMLQHIEHQVGVIAGVSEQRQGQIENRETVGGVERSVTQSSHITEKWFFLHDETKKRAMAALLDTAKQLWSKSKSKKLSYIMDDMSRDFIEFNGEDFASTEQDIFISNSSHDAKISSLIESLTQPLIQNGMGSIVVELMQANSIAEKNLIMKEQEEKIQQQRQQAQEQQTKIAQMQAEQLAAQKQAELDFKYKELEMNTELEYAKLEAMTGRDAGSNDYNKMKLNLAENKLENDKAFKQKQLNETYRHNQQAEQISKLSKTKQ